jgi:trigger factor
MKVDVKDLSPVKKSMSIEVDAEEVEKETQEVLRSYAQKARIPGFRQGKVPLSVIRSRFAQEVREDVRDRVVSRSYHEAAREKGLRPIGDPVLEDVEFETGQPLRFKTVFEVLPEFELKAYKGMEARRPAVTVDDAEVQQTLEQLRQAQTKLRSTDGVASATGDVIVADVEGAPEEGETFRQDNVMLEVGATDNLPQFNENLLEVKPGDEREFAVDYPQEYAGKELAGKTVRYKLVVHDVKNKEVPELDDEFAKDLGDFDGLDALREKIVQDLEGRKRAEAERTVRQSVLDKVLLENPMVLPDVLVEEEIRHRLEEIVRTMMIRGMDPKEAEIDWERLRKDQEAPARKSVHARLILDAVAVAETLEVTDDEVRQRIRDDAQRLGESPDKLRRNLEKGAGIEALKNQMVREKSLDLLTSVANIHNED